jgi:hypothetical protein
MKRPAVEIVRFIPFEKAAAYRRRGFTVAPHPHGNHRRFGLIASKPAKKARKK